MVDKKEFNQFKDTIFKKLKKLDKIEKKVDALLEAWDVTIAPSRAEYSQEDVQGDNPLLERIYDGYEEEGEPVKSVSSSCCDAYVYWDKCWHCALCKKPCGITWDNNIKMLYPASKEMESPKNVSEVYDFTEKK